MSKVSEGVKTMYYYGPRVKSNTEGNRAKGYN